MQRNALCRIMQKEERRKVATAVAGGRCNCSEWAKVNLMGGAGGKQRCPQGTASVY